VGGAPVGSRARSSFQRPGPAGSRQNRLAATADLLDPRRTPDSAATTAQLFARAHIVLAALKAHGQ
jgi:hypothetical protein